MGCGTPPSWGCRQEGLMTHGDMGLATSFVSFPVKNKTPHVETPRCFMNGGSRKSSERLMFSAWGTYRNPETELKGEVSKEGNGQGRWGVSFASRLAWVAPWWLCVKGNGTAWGCLEQVGGLFRKPLALPQVSGWAISRLTCIWANAETCGFPCRKTQLGFQTSKIYFHS